MAAKNKKVSFHFQRAGLFALLLAALFIVRVDAGSASPVQSRVLAYAVEMSHGALLSGTNSARGANGLGGLALNSQLNNSAQMKAQDMADKNYWAHVAPDGTQPWYFFNQAGYAYIRAGENLAYGFSTSQGAIDGWMNSPSHRANILGDYQDVGFGIVNTPDYQSNGNQTIVVAHYGTKSNPAPAPAPAAPTAPIQATPLTPPPSPTATPEPTTPSEPEASPTSPVDTQTETADDATPQQNTDQSAKLNNEEEQIPVQTGTESQVSVLSMMANKNLPAAALMSLMMVSFAVIGYALTHRAAFHHAVAAGEHFVVRHPGVDTGIIAALTSLILLTSYGNLS